MPKFDKNFIFWKEFSYAAKLLSFRDLNAPEERTEINRLATFVLSEGDSKFALREDEK